MSHTIMNIVSDHVTDPSHLEICYMAAMAFVQAERDRLYAEYGDAWLDHLDEEKQEKVVGLFVSRLSRSLLSKAKIDG